MTLPIEVRKLIKLNSSVEINNFIFKGRKSKIRSPKLPWEDVPPLISRLPTNSRSLKKVVQQDNRATVSIRHL